MQTGLEEFNLNFDLVTISGDFEKFLQGQITTDMRNLRENSIDFTSFCDPKGRVVASGWILRSSANQVLLILAKGGFDLLYDLLKKFLPFYKNMRIEKVNGAYKVFALDLQNLSDLSELLDLENLQNLQNLPDIKPEKNQTDSFSTKNVEITNQLLQADQQSTKKANLNFINKDLQKCENCFIENKLVFYLAIKYIAPYLLVIIPNNFDIKTDANFLNELKDAKFLNQVQWNILQAQAGLVLVDANLSAKYQPQMLNYGDFAGISLNKGCYTGQEVIARLEFRGKIKSCISLFEASKICNSKIPTLGDKIFFDSKEVGEVVFVAEQEENFLLLCYIKQDILEQTGLFLVNSDEVLKTEIVKVKQ